MTYDKRASCINTIELLRQVVSTRYGLDVVDDKNCDKIIEMLINYPRWIPCSERPPELDDEVLVTDDHNCIRHCMFCKRGETWRGFVTYEEGMTIDAIAWQPLPSPYREEADE